MITNNEKLLPESLITSMSSNFPFAGKNPNDDITEPPSLLYAHPGHKLHNCLLPNDQECHSVTLNEKECLLSQSEVTEPDWK
jgi:hypothetical protein